MGVNTNTWNKIRYTFYTPIYDLIGKRFNQSRKLSIDSLDIKKGDKILIIGAGTGLDLEYLPSDCEVVATDITPTMVARITRRAAHENQSVNAMVMDGQALLFPADTFDKIILHLILAVIPDPVACIQESERVLKPGGEIVVFDKFLRKDAPISIRRKALNVITNLLFSDITREFETIINNTNLNKVSDKPANFNGFFRLIKLVKE